MRRISFPLLLFAVTACHASGDRGSAPGDTDDTRPFSAIGSGETLHFTGTEPFWGGEVTGAALTYRTPENDGGSSISVSRFAGRGGLSFSGRLDDASFDLSVTEGRCSDGMSDRRYPFTATLRIGGEVRSGCAWSDSHPVVEARPGG